MPPKGKKEIDEADLPPIDRSLVKLRLLGVDPTVQAEIRSRVAKSKRKDLIIISRDKVLEYAEANGLYINPETWDQKKKLPEGVPTVLSEELTIDLYKKYIREQDLMGRQHKLVCLEAEKAGKEPPMDPRFVDDPKKDAKKKEVKKKDPKAPEEVEEKEPEERQYERGGDYLYLLLDEFEREETLHHLEDFEGLTFFTVSLEGIHSNQSQQPVDADEILRSQIKDSEKFVSDLRRRLYEYVLNAEGKPEKDKELSDLERVEKELRLYETHIRQNLKQKSVWSWHCRYMSWNVADLKATDPSVHWAYHLREQLVEAVSADSILWRSYFDWLCSLNIVKVTSDTPLLYVKSKELQVEKERIQKLKEEQARLAEEEKNKKGGKGAAKPEPKKDPPKKVDKPGPKGGKDQPKQPEKPEEDLQKSLVIKPKVEDRKIEPPKPTKWRLFEVIEKQMKLLTIEYLTGGAYLESFIDEIEARSLGGLTSKVEPSISDQSLYSYLDHVFGSLLSAKILNEKEIIREADPADSSRDQLHTKFKHIYYEEDKVALRYGQAEFSNHDKLAEREGLILKHINLPAIEEFRKNMQKESRDLRAEALQHTEQRAGITTNLSEYYRLQHIHIFEDMFNKEVGMIDWDFKNRVYIEHLTDLQLSQWLVSLVKDEPEVLTHIDSNTGALYIGLFFKSPSGRMLYKNWQAERTLIPSYESYLLLPSEVKSAPPDYFNLAEDQTGVFTERRTLIMPADGSRVDVRVSKVLFQERPRVNIFKRDITIVLKQSVPIAESAVRELIKKEAKTLIYLSKGQEASSNLEVVDQDASAIAAPQEEEQADDSEELSKRAAGYLEALDRTGECLFEFKYQVRFLFEASLARVDEEDLESEKKMMGSKVLETLRQLSSLTITKRDGRLLKVDGSGAIVQLSPQPQDTRSARVLEAIGLSAHSSQELREVHRTVTGKGTVTRFFHDGTHCIYYASGHIDISSKGDYYYTIHPQGKKELVDKKQHKTVETIPFSVGLDPETGIRHLARKDNFIRFDYPDQSRLVIFPDSTRIYSSPDRTLFRVHHAVHHTVEVRYDYFRARNPSLIGPGGAFATKGRENIFERIFNGRLATVKLDCGIELQVFKEMRELEGYNNFRLVTVTLVSSPDDKVIKFENYGEIVYIDKKDYVSKETASMRLGWLVDRLQARTNTLQRGQEAVFPEGDAPPREPKPFDHFIQLFLPCKERAAGVLTADLNAGEVTLKDSESNQFTVNKNGRIRSHISVSFNLNLEKPLWDDPPKFEGEEYVDPVNFDLPVPKDWQKPMLALIDRDGLAQVFYEESMLQDYFEDKRFCWSMLVKSFQQATNAQNLAVLTRTDRPMLTAPAAPSYCYPSEFRGLPVSKLVDPRPEAREYAVRSLTLCPSFQPADKSLLEDVERSQRAWAQSKVRAAEEAQVFRPSEEEKTIELELQQKLLVLGQQHKNIIVYGQSNKAEISNPSNVVFADS